jgi:cytoskeleton protein RodZ
MTDTNAASPTPLPVSPSQEVGAAGAMLRAARQQQGLHIAALAASIKVSPARLEALETGRYEELLDVTFARALAQTVCRVLKIDPVPVLAQMPGSPPDALGRVDGGLNTPFRDRPGRSAAAEWLPWRHPVRWLVVLLLMAAAAFVLVPPTSLRDIPMPGLGGKVPTLISPGSSGMSSGVVDSFVLPPIVPAPPEEDVPAPAPAVGAAALPVASLSAVAVASAAKRGTGDAVVLRALQATWVQAVDGSGQTLLSRLVPAGETVELTVTPPVRLRIGNVSGTELSFRGQRVDVQAAARDNIANITLP